MLDIDRSTIRDGILVHNDSKYSENPNDVKGRHEHWFNEGSSIRKRNGIYYLVYAQGGRHGRGCCACLAYATSTSPMGPFTYRGVIIDNYGSGTNLVNNHGCIAEIDHKWYVFYHRPTHATSSMRKACVEPIRFNPDGTIPEVEMTTQGVGGPIDPLDRMDAARACLMSGNVRVTERRMAAGATVEELSCVRDGDTATWRYFDFNGKGAKRFVCKTWGKNKGANIEIHLDKADGTLIGTCNLTSNTGEVAYGIHATAVKSVKGVHALVFVFRGAPGQDLLNLEWFAFEGNPSK
jgi:hypothetical protein